MGGSKYTLHFRCEWGGGCLWPGDDAARRAFDLGPYDQVQPCPLPLSGETIRRCWALAAWHDTSLNWDYPPDPGPWRQAECERFNSAAAELLEIIRQELGPEFEVLDRQVQVVEDPELDKYLANPKCFRRGSP